MGKKEQNQENNELIDKSINEWQELTKEENKIQIKPVVVTVPPPPKES